MRIPWIQLLTLLRVGGGPVLLLVLLSRLDIAELVASFARARWSMVLLATALQLVYGFLLAERWRLLLTAFGSRDSPAGSYETYEASLRGCYYGQFLPSSLGGDVAKSAVLLARGHAPATVATSVLVDRLIGVITMAVVGVACLPFSGLMDITGMLQSGIVWLPQFGLVLGLAIVSGATLVLVGATLGRRSSTLKRFLQTRFWRTARAAVTPVSCQPRPLALATVVSLAAHGTLVGATLLTFASFGQAVSAPALGWVLFVTSVGLMLPITINGLGLREAALSVLLAPLGVPSTIAVSAGLAAYLASTVQALLGGLLEIGNVRGQRTVMQPVAAVHNAHHRTAVSK